MKPHQILPSTTSHKHEPLELTLDVFARLGFQDLDLNLWHVIEEGVDAGLVKRALAARGQRLWIVSGGWCDFYHDHPRIDETFHSVDRQVQIAGVLGVSRMRLFFGRLSRAAYSGDSLAVISRNLQRLADRHPHMQFVFENHDGASLRPEICREILEATDRPTVRMNFDPINFEHAGVDSMAALVELRPLIEHVHLKGLDRGGYCEFGAGDVDLGPVLQSLVEGGYAGAFTVEYEGPSDRTLGLHAGVRNATAAVDQLSRRATVGSGPSASGER